MHTTQIHPFQNSARAMKSRGAANPRLARFATALLAPALALTVAAALPASAIRSENGAVPSEIVGKWSFTTVSGVNYRDTYTNQLAAPSGRHRTITFTRDGHFKQYTYMRVRTYNLVSEFGTSEEGTVTFGNGTYKLHVTRGHYDGSTGRRKINRDMKPSERKDSTYYWEARTEDGKRKLYIGPDASSKEAYQRAN